MATNEHDPTYVAGFNDGFRRALRELRDGLDSLADEDGSLSGGDCVDYVYRMFDRIGIEALNDDDEVVFSVAVPGIGSTVFLYGDDDTLRGTRADLLLLARNIHDTLEGHDHDHP